ncbi:MAG: alcohol dehydrogenase catalytic domain-containing protein [bacterium]|nr:alcohol dehydrogenase catalytic domain-containing protein [bacterium]MCP5064977.1 alcohol dehydrogenase catalytic domain-containing protein [bacterium]
MKALVLHGKGDVRAESVPDPTPQDAHSALVKVERAAICGSDLHLYHGDVPAAPGLVVGHEFVGEVMEVGSEVTNIRTGDHVMVSGVIGCGQCKRCLNGEVVRCERKQTRVFGMAPELPGGQAEAVAVPGAEHAIRRIPEGVSVEQAVLLTDILPTGYFGARNADIEPGETVVVIGAGPVGLLALLSAQLFGPARVLVVDRIPERLALAAELGGIPVSAEHADSVIAEMTNEQGADRIIEAVGSDATILKAIEWVRAAGTVSVVGVNTSPAVPFPMIHALMKDLTFRVGLVPVPELWSALIPLVACGRLQPERVFTHRMGLSEGAEAYRRFNAREDGILKVLLDPSR